MASIGLNHLSLPPRDGLVSGPLSPATPSTPGLAPRNSNPLTSKVTSVLSTSYADAEFREALNLLDDRRVGNNPETRRQLRLEIQKDVIESNGQIITEFGRVADHLRRIGATIDKLNRNYHEMKTHVTAAHEATSSTLEETSNLMAQKQKVEKKQQILQALRNHFVLPEDDIAALCSASEPVDDRFFMVLAKTKKIQKDCELLLGFENQTLGLEVMEQASKHLNQAFQKLYRWTQREFKTLNLENPQINSSVRRALRVLAERPSLFQNCLDFFAEAREQILSDSFYLALTGTSASGREDHSVKPIDLVAHDPLRYVGDMLAWTHSATVSEREALEVLFVSDGNEIAKGLQEGRENELWRLMADEADGSSEFDAVKALNELVDRNVSGAARVLRQRVEQVIQTNEDTILAYKLANLLGFYRFTFSKLLGPRSILLESLTNVETEALRQFRSLMRDHIATLQGEFQHTPSDLGPPDFLQESLKQLIAIMKTYDSSLASTGDRESEFQPILSESFDPFVSGCENMSRTIAGYSSSIFLINCLLAAKAALEPFDFTKKRVHDLQHTVEEHTDILIQSQYTYLKTESGLAPLFDALGSVKRSEVDIATARMIEALQPGALTAASQALDDFLPSALMDATENLRHLQDSKLAREVTEAAAEKFCVAFEHVEEILIAMDELAEQPPPSALADELSSSQSLRALFPRTTGEIRVLLS
ncbi:Conserved oligomeric Golgi complex subunit 6 [Pestalotiopsis fici W106-1]|uniref:Conserved oligomeric Golgi complex subunit 6 n=1 Tax=Pestalotiopsis fici (strain W106-1 / CGMCC3.15140) TaxID=1229662 RepID=W3XHE2_PESFW|nr:Conserved oligomeric Golgi complex subunit 6 [Pestalotiopsis fici W106-1]ETS85503.1 Conserved oligomeric Golgi complex subunit 6 [Pestalotiopsis fici W106-1]